MSSSVMFLPRPGVSASAVPAPNTAVSASESKTLRVDMFDLPFAVDAPAGDAVVVLVRECERARDRPFGLAARGHELCAGRLHVAAFVPGATLQHHWLAVPAPWHAEADEGLRINRALQRGLAPALAAVGRDHHPRDASSTRIGDAGDLVEARALERMPGRRMGDERLDLLQEVELPEALARNDL